MSDNVPIIVCLLLYVVTALVSVLLVKFCIVLAERARILDVANERSLHTGVKPRTGGLAFLLLVTLAGIFICVNLYLEQTLPHWSLLGAGLLVGLISFYDDLKGLSTKLRFAMHFTAAGAVLFFHPVLLPMTLPGGLLIQNEYLVLGCLLLWMVGLTNAYNFMDGCDGIAGGQALMAGLGWVMLTLCFPINTEVMIYGAVIAGTATGFLCYNWQPSKLFLGDVGSAFLGFTFAWMPLLAADIAEDIALTLGAGALLLWPFIMDASFTFGRRLLRGENVFKAHRSHLYQRLVLSGWSHARVSLLYMGLAITGWPLAWVWSTGHAWVIVLCPSVVLVLFLALCLLVRAVENKTTQIPKSVQ